VQATYPTAFAAFDPRAWIAGAKGGAFWSRVVVVELGELEAVDLYRGYCPFGQANLFIGTTRRATRFSETIG